MKRTAPANTSSTSPDAGKQSTEGSVGQIRFYRASGKYGFLSNLWRCEVYFDDRLFPSSEHAYQFGKPRDPRVADYIMTAPYPWLVAQVAHSLVKWQVRGGWQRVKVDRMRGVLRAKFNGNPNLASRLVETGDAELVEASRSDGFWGIGRNGKGKNMLGRLLMEIRAELRLRQAA